MNLNLKTTQFTANALNANLGALRRAEGNENKMEKPVEKSTYKSPDDVKKAIGKGHQVNGETVDIKIGDEVYECTIKVTPFGVYAMFPDGVKGADGESGTCIIPQKK